MKYSNQTDSFILRDLNARSTTLFPRFLSRAIHIHVLTLFIILTLWSNIIIIHPFGVQGSIYDDHNTTSGHFKSFPNCKSGHIFNGIQIETSQRSVRSQLECAKLCSVNLQCVAYNYIKYDSNGGSGKSKRRCELLGTSAENCMDLDVKANSSFKYSTTRVSADKVKNESNWILAFEADDYGQPLAGDLNELFDATKEGFPISVRITNSTTRRTFLSTCYQLDVTATKLCAHIPFGVSVDGLDELTNSSVWVFSQVCTDGQLIQYSNTFPTPVYTSVSTSWYYRPFSCASSTNDSSDELINLHKGKIMQGNLEDFRTNLYHGYRNIVLRHDINYGQGKQTVQVPSNFNVYVAQTVAERTKITDHVFALHVWSFLTKNSGTDSAYLACRLSSTDGQDKFVGWNLDSHSQDEIQKTSKSKHSWLLDPCWKHLYTSPDANNTESGSLDDLIFEVKNGHSIRLRITDDDTMLFVEASHVVITPDGVVVAQILGNIKTQGFTFDPEGSWSWYFVHSHGYQCRYDVSISSHREIRSTCRNSSAVWFADSGEYDTVFETDDTGKTVTGTRSNLRHAVMSGGQWRVKVELEGENGLERYLAVERIEQHAETDVSALSMRSVVSVLDTQGRMRLDSSCLGVALLVCSDSRVLTRRWRAGILEGGVSSLMANVTWFVSQ